MLDSGRQKRTLTGDGSDWRFCCEHGAKYNDNNAPTDESCMEI